MPSCPYQDQIEDMPLHEHEAKCCRKLGYFAKLTPEGWKPCSGDEPGAMPDLNRYMREFGIGPTSCPLWGHDCPGGVAQIKICKN